MVFTSKVRLDIGESGHTGMVSADRSYDSNSILLEKPLFNSSVDYYLS